MRGICWHTRPYYFSVYIYIVWWYQTIYFTEKTQNIQVLCVPYSRIAYWRPPWGFVSPLHAFPTRAKAGWSCLCFYSCAWLYTTPSEPLNEYISPYQYPWGKVFKPETCWVHWRQQSICISNMVIQWKVYFLCVFEQTLFYMCMFICSFCINKNMLF